MGGPFKKQKLTTQKWIFVPQNYFSIFLYSNKKAFKKINYLGYKSKMIYSELLVMKYVLIISVYRHQVLAFKYRMQIYKKCFKSVKY